MASYTPTHHLPKYDSTDKPNLRDQYNQAMDTIDDILTAFSGNIASAQQSAASAQATANEAKTSATSASTVAKNAQSTATAAQSAAKAAQADVNHRGYISIEKFGCSTASSDNSAAFQDAVDYSSANGCAIYVPAGTYKLNSPIDLTPGFNIQGNMAVSHLKFASKSGFKAPVDSSGHQITYGIMDGLFIEGPETGPLASGSKVNAGFYGMLIGGHVANVYIKGFEFGINLTQEVSNPEYNNYLYAYGDNRCFENIFLKNGYVGINCDESDVPVNGLTINAFTSPMFYAGGTASNIHVYGCRRGITLNTGVYNNVIVESQYLTNGASGTAESFIILSGSAQLNGVYLWNAMNMASATGNQPYIFINPGATNKNICINGLLIGADVDSPTELKKFILGAQTVVANNSITVIGEIDSKIEKNSATVVNPPSQTCLNVEKFNSVYAFITANYALKGAIDISTPTGYNVFSTSK